jgi:hypothetical protein
MQEASVYEASRSASGKLTEPLWVGDQLKDNCSCADQQRVEGNKTYQQQYTGT